MRKPGCADGNQVWVVQHFHDFLTDKLPWLAKAGGGTKHCSSLGLVHWLRPKAPRAAAISARSAVRKERCACWASIDSPRTKESKQDSMQSDAVLLFHGLDLSARVLWTTPTRRKQQSQHSAARSAPLAVITAAPGLRTVCNYTPRSKAINWSVPPSAGQRLTVPNCPAPTFSWTLDKIANSLTVAHPMEPWQVLDSIESLARTGMLSRFIHG